MGTESGDGLADKPIKEVARALEKALWSKVNIEPTGLITNGDSEVHVTFHVGDAAMLAEYLRDSERRPF